MSFIRLTHAPPQHAKPGPQSESATHASGPPLELDVVVPLLLEELPVLLVRIVVGPPGPSVLVVCPPAPPLPVVTELPQPARAAAKRMACAARFIGSTP